MTARDWFTLALRVLGIWLLIQAVPAIAYIAIIALEGWMKFWGQKFGLPEITSFFFALAAKHYFNSC